RLRRPRAVLDDDDEGRPAGLPPLRLHAGPRARLARRLGPAGARRRHRRDAPRVPPTPEGDPVTTFGLSAYFRHLDVAEEVCATARADGFTMLFGSLHVPEEPEGDFRARMQRVGALAQESGLGLVVDISGPSLAAVGLDVSTAGTMQDWGVTALRVDYGLSDEEIVALSRSIPIWFNASTATPGDFERLVGMGMSTEGLGISHNFYPKVWTGLSDEFLDSQTRMFQELG